MSVPKLRFRDDDGKELPCWKKITIEDLEVKVIDGDRGTNYPNGNDFSNDGYCLFLNAKNVTKSGFSFDELSFISKEKDEQLRKGKLVRNDLVITTRGTVGNIAYFNEGVPYENMRINSGMIIIRSESDDISSNYFYQYFYSPILIKIIGNIAFGSAQPQLTVKEINKIKVGVPSLSEQTKIANFLTAVDEKITLLTQKADLLSQYKKGVMQQIFSQELRFKDDDGQEFPEWEEKKLGDIADITTGNSNRIDSTIGDGAYTFFDRSQDIRTSDIYLFDCEAVIVAGEGQEFIPKHFIGKFDLHQRTYAIIKFKSASGKYLFYYIHNFRYYFLSQAVGSTVKSLRLPMFQQMPIQLPSLPEQTKIANFLTAIDEKITINETQLNTVKQYKQGLLQQMFV